MKLCVIVSCVYLGWLILSVHVWMSPSFWSIERHSVRRVEVPDFSAVTIISCCFHENTSRKTFQDSRKPPLTKKAKQAFIVPETWPPLPKVELLQTVAEFVCYFVPVLAFCILDCVSVVYFICALQKATNQRWVATKESNAVFQCENGFWSHGSLQRIENLLCVSILCFWVSTLIEKIYFADAPKY